ncbi:MAG: trypsin-like peptidase domain-containing protein [Chthoniobacter sp.]|uniref:trypsin-like peptidase domain-containing protein n=1 Tax=Chthoniobacter sp. TaxID=2510640 RepID=UPI0032A2D780
MPFRIPAVLLALAVLPLAGVSAADGDKEKGAAALGLLKAIDDGFVQVFEKVAPTVVIIDAIKRTNDDDDELPRGFEFFLDDGRPGRRDTPKVPGPPTHSEGSGFIVRKDGYILTNHHVVADAEKLTVRLKDGRSFSAKLIGGDDRTDVAVIKIEAKDLPTVEWGDSEKLRVGQMVCAIGAPFSQDYSFTVGWVSGKNRTNLLGPSSTTILFEDYIQTDAFINPGNSGGPLFDVEGKIVGMNTLINGLGHGLAFAIPAGMLQDVGQQLIATGKVQRPWLGIRIETLADNSSLRAHLVGIEQGVVVDTVEADAPAYKSDLRPADVITEVDGVKVNSAHDLQRLILKKRIGQPVNLTVWRAGSTLQIAVATGELPMEVTKVANVAPAKDTPGAKAETLGLKLRDGKPTGAHVLSVAAGSPAAHAEIFADDVITGVESKPVNDAAGCVSAITTGLVTKGNKGVLINIERQGRRAFVILNPRLPSPP